MQKFYIPDLTWKIIFAQGNGIPLPPPNPLLVYDPDH